MFCGADDGRCLGRPQQPPGLRRGQLVRGCRGGCAGVCGRTFVCACLSAERVTMGLTCIPTLRASIRTLSPVWTQPAQGHWHSSVLHSALAPRLPFASESHICAEPLRRSWCRWLRNWGAWTTSRLWSFACRAGGNTTTPQTRIFASRRTHITAEAASAHCPCCERTMPSLRPISVLLWGLFHAPGEQPVML